MSIYLPSNLSNAIHKLFNSNLSLQIADLRSNARKLVDQIGSIDESQLPPFIKPVKNLVYKVQNVLTTVKSDIMGFFNVSNTVKYIAFKLL